MCSLAFDFLPWYWTLILHPESGLIWWQTLTQTLLRSRRSELHQELQEGFLSTHLIISDVSVSLWMSEHLYSQMTHSPAWFRLFKWRGSHLPGQIKHVCVSIIEGEEDTGQSVDLLLCDGSAQILLQVSTNAWRRLITYSSRPSGFKQFRPYLIPQCNLSSVPPGDACGEDTLQITQKHHAVHSAAFTVCFLFRWTHWTELNKQARFKYICINVEIYWIIKYIELYTHEQLNIMYR